MITTMDMNTAIITMMGTTMIIRTIMAMHMITTMFTAPKAASISAPDRQGCTCRA